MQKGYPPSPRPPSAFLTHGTLRTCCHADADTAQSPPRAPGKHGSTRSAHGSREPAHASTSPERVTRRRGSSHEKSVWLASMPSLSGALRRAWYSMGETPWQNECALDVVFSAVAATSPRCQDARFVLPAEPPAAAACIAASTTTSGSMTP